MVYVDISFLSSGLPEENHAEPGSLSMPVLFNKLIVRVRNAGVMCASGCPVSQQTWVEQALPMQAQGSRKGRGHRDRRGTGCSSWAWNMRGQGPGVGERGPCRWKSSMKPEGKALPGALLQLFFPSPQATLCRVGIDSILSLC